jgi:hypothetical protein
MIGHVLDCMDDLKGKHLCRWGSRASSRWSSVSGTTLSTTQSVQLVQRLMATVTAGQREHVAKGI